MYYNPAALATGQTELETLSSDVTLASTYLSTHLGSFSQSDAGLIFQVFIGEHAKTLEASGNTFTAAQRLLANAGSNLGKTRERYHTVESNNTLQVNDIFRDLDSSQRATPLGPDPTGTAVPGPLPSTQLKVPEGGSFDHWIWDVLSWPDWISVGAWARKIINWVVTRIWTSAPRGDIFEALSVYLMGDWDKLEKAGEAWSSLMSYLMKSAVETEKRMSIMFRDWYGEAGAERAGEYFAEASRAIFDASTPHMNLARQYGDVAWAAFLLHQTLWGYVDAAIDAFVAALLGVGSIAELIAAIFTGGLTAIPAIASAIAAVVETISATWGAITSTIYAIGAIVSLIDAACLTIEFNTIPEG